MPKSSFFILTMQPYGLDVVVSIAQSNKGFVKSMKAYDPDGDYERGLMEDGEAGRAFITAGNVTILRLRDAPSTPYTIGVLAHEAFHAVAYLLRRVGMQFEMGVSDEAYTYAIQWLTQTILERADFRNQSILSQRGGDHPQ